MGERRADNLRQAEEVLAVVISISQAHVVDDRGNVTTDVRCLCQRLLAMDITSQEAHHEASGMSVGVQPCPWCSGKV